MSHTANTRPLAIRIPAHYYWMKMRSGEYPFRALGNCPAGDSFRSLKICLQQLPVDCCAFFRPHFGGCSGCCRTAIVRKTSYTVYRTMYSPPSSGSGKAVAYKLYLYIHKCACTVGEKNRFYGVDIDSDPGHHFWYESGSRKVSQIWRKYFIEKIEVEFLLTHSF